MSKGFIVQLENDKVRVTLRRRTAGGAYYAKWWQHCSEAGKSKQYDRSTDAFDEREARNAARGMVEANAKAAKKTGLDFKAAVKQYLAERWPDQHTDAERGAYITGKVENLTCRDHRQRLLQFVELCGEHDVGATDFDMASLLVQRYINAIKAKGNSPTTQDNGRRIVSRFFTWVIKQRNNEGKHIVDWRANPAAKLLLEIEEVEDKLLPPIPPEEEQEMIDTVRNSGSELWPVMLLCIGMGLRPSEATRMTWDCINLFTKKMVVRSKKTGDREINISTWTMTELMKLKKPDHGKFWPYVRHYMFRIMDRLRGQKTWSLQACRRTACRKAAPTMDIKQYAHHFGHSIETAQKHYIGYGLMGTTASLDCITYDRPEQKPEQNRKDKTA